MSTVQGGGLQQGEQPGVSGTCSLWRSAYADDLPCGGLWLPELTQNTQYIVGD